jgi:transcriptional regulator with XRE-family HTH domain
MKERQSSKMREIRGALVAAGISVLDEQAKALGLSRSTTWTILRGNHKGSGLSAAIIHRILAASHLPPLVRVKILEYIEEKSAGHYGDSEARRRSFAERLSAKRRGEARDLPLAGKSDPRPGVARQRHQRRP